MSTVIKRLLIFFIGTPAVAALVLFLPFHGHLVLNIAVVLFSALGAVEFSLMLEKKQFLVKKAEAFIIGALLPLSFLLTINFNLPQWIIPLLITAGASWALLSSVFSAADKMETVTYRLAGILSVLIYPGFFMCWIIKMTTLQNPGVIVLVFLLIVFGSDSAAWLCGTLFGKGNRGIIPASPNKSIAGYIGGIIGSIIIGGGAVLLIPLFKVTDVFVIRGSIEGLPVIIAAIILGLLTGISAALGDLAESAVKRSCGVKDSGSLMPGRGGVLDSIDSVAFAAPVFFALYSLFFTNL